MGKSSLSITVASALPSSSPSPPPLPPLGPHLFKLGQAGHPPPSPATSVRSNIKPRSRQPHIQGPSLQRRLSGAFSTRNLEVLPSLVTPQSAHPVPGGDGASGGSPSPHECVLVSTPIKPSHSRVPLPPFPPPHPPPSIHPRSCTPAAVPCVLWPCTALPRTCRTHIHNQDPPRLPACLSHPDPPSILLQPRHTSSWQLPCPSCCRIPLLDYAIPHPSSSHDLPGLVLLFWFLLTRIPYI